MRSNPSLFMVVAGLCFQLCAPASAADDLNPRTPETFLSDGAYVVTAPFRFKQQSAWLALGAVGVTVTSSLLDRTFRDHFIGGINSTAANNWRKFSDVAQVVGPAIGTGLYIEGSLNDNDHSKETGYLVYECFAWTVVIEGSVNYVVGRERPEHTDNPRLFKPFSWDSSFPSGHTTQAFAAATVFSEQYPHWYVAVPAYSIAAATGYGRLPSSKHWFSDIVGGSMLGMFIAHTIRTHRRREDLKEQVTWDLSTDGHNIQLVRHF